MRMATRPASPLRVLRFSGISTMPSNIAEQVRYWAARPVSAPVDRRLKVEMK